MTSIAILAGSFDPPTFGHLWMIEQAKTLFDEVYVLVGLNSGKKSLFTGEERLHLLNACLNPPKKQEWLVATPEVASIFETGTAGFGPVGGWYEVPIHIDIMHGNIDQYVEENLLPNENYSGHENVVLVRGIRGIGDVEYEGNIADYQRSNHGFETVIFFSPKEYSEFSSSLVKDFARMGKWEQVEKMVPFVVK